jgi:3-hydroxy-9,10-secoandrosta-1,3,5(10)-triene-9,17-dione monooxygenase
MAGAGQKPNVSPSAGPDGDDLAYAAMIGRAKALIPQLRERASRTEELRRLPPETERDLHDSGLFRIVQPKRVGGSEFDYVALVDCADALGQADASVAWNFANLASHHWMLGMFDQRAQDLVWNQDANALIASSFIFPAGRARKVDGGYVLSGSWPFSSGVDASEWNMLASVVSSDDEADGIEYRIFLLNKSDYKITDTWNASGLRGTGSNDVEVSDAFVAEPMTLAVRCSRCFRMCFPVWRSETRRPVWTIMSISRGIAHRPTIAPNWPISRARRSRLQRLPRRSTRPG